MKLQSLFLMLLKFLNEICQKIFSKMGSMLQSQTDVILIAAAVPECVDCWRQGKIAESQSVLVKHSVIVGNSQTNSSQNASRQRQKSFCDGIYIER